MQIEIISKKEYGINKTPIYEFHIADKLRKRCEVSEELFSISGNVVFANINQVRRFVTNFNKSKNDIDKIKVSEVNAAGLIDEIFHFTIREYEDKNNPNLFEEAIKYLQKRIGSKNLEKLLFEFTELFPPVAVYKGEATATQYLSATVDGKSNKAITLEEMLLLNFANINHANKKLIELFDENYFSKKEDFNRLINELEIFLKDNAKIGPGELDIFSYLEEPLNKFPNNLEDQLDYILNNWNVTLRDRFENRIIINKDLIKEEISFDFGGGDGEVETIVPNYKGEYVSNAEYTLGKSNYNYAEGINTEYEETEQFTADIQWMPNVILMAKNIYVWLDQLSKKYKREIHRLDQIPDEELDELSRRNINGLWLIGLWERSSASKKIKHIMGNIDAVASAYSLYDYKIAYDIGGEEVYNIFNESAKERGIRLASDMVPNHTGIYSDWVRNHPEYFVQVSEPPFDYHFTGEDLSEDPNIEIKIEDGYWEKRDAAVVFRRIDKRYNDVRYIYHGNDGTNMPWNDTAQLDMLKSEVREAVIEKIFEVARKFSIIRFDAAMTLAKKHFSRLWYPQPGMGGDIPSRTDFSMSREEFDSFFPVEFWREVVDRINNEMPQTLLLAEAFWLMEGYFVRTLGMHRVYNSAFMHMMMKEENGKYRELIYNTLEFEPEILKRYVNFMSNPDEKTAIEQYGTDDKYFGVLTMMITLPGLPMFAHGQIEGYTEKYGMEYKRAYYDEQPKDWLVDRHEREIFPITRKRYLFSEVENFWFYDFYDLEGNLNDNIFVYSNNFGNEKSLVLYNNKYDKVYGNFQKSTPKLVKIDGNNKYIKKINAAEALGIKGDDNCYYILKDVVTNLEFIFNGADLWQSGFYFELNGFERRVYTDITEVVDLTGDYKQLYTELNGSGVYSIKNEIENKKLTPIYDAFNKVMAEYQMSIFNKLSENKLNEKERVEILKPIFNKIDKFISEIAIEKCCEISKNKIKDSLFKNIQGVIKLNSFFDTDSNYKKNSKIEADDFFLLKKTNEQAENIKLFFAVFLLSEIKLQIDDVKITSNMFNKILSNYFEKEYESKDEEEVIFNKALLTEILIEYFTPRKDSGSIEKIKTINPKKDEKDFVLKNKELIQRIFDDNYVHKYIEVNIYKGIRYFNKERYEILIKWLLNMYFFKKVLTSQNFFEVLEIYLLVFKYLKDAAEKSEYKYDELEELLIH